VIDTPNKKLQYDDDQYIHIGSYRGGRGNRY